MNNLKEKINRIYYDWANDPEFVRIEKYPDDKTPADSFIKLFQKTYLEAIGDKEVITAIFRRYNKYPEGIDPEVFILEIEKMARNELRHLLREAIKEK